LWASASGRIPRPGSALPALAAAARLPVINSPCVEFEFHSVAAVTTATAAQSVRDDGGSLVAACVQQVLVSLDFCPWASFVSTRSPFWGTFVSMLSHDWKYLTRAAL
jgi:hypothetical protein